MRKGSAKFGKIAIPMQLEQLLPLEKLQVIASRPLEYQNAEPFPHIVVDNFLSPDVLSEIMASFPDPRGHDWLRYKAPAERDKLQSTSELAMPAPIRAIFAAFNSSTFVRFLETLTGIDGIIPDPHLYGGGMHQTLPGGHLKMHIDYNRHNKWKLERRLNAILYLNDDWRDEWGGALELWDSNRETKEMTRCVEKVFPAANRFVIFSTTEHSWHGHPEPLACPEGRTRKSIALYYYTNTVKEDTPDHTTIFKERPAETFKYVTWKDVARDLMPPAILRVAKKMRHANNR